MLQGAGEPPSGSAEPRRLAASAASGFSTEAGHPQRIFAGRGFALGAARRAGEVLPHESPPLVLSQPAPRASGAAGDRKRRSSLSCFFGVRSRREAPFSSLWTAVLT